LTIHAIQENYSCVDQPCTSNFANTDSTAVVFDREVPHGNNKDILEQAIRPIAGRLPDGPSEELLRETLKQVEHENT
jgi:hypothetical protein